MVVVVIVVGMVCVLYFLDVFVRVMIMSLRSAHLTFVWYAYCIYTPRSIDVKACKFYCRPFSIYCLVIWCILLEWYDLFWHQRFSFRHRSLLYIVLASDSCIIAYLNKQIEEWLSHSFEWMMQCYFTYLLFLVCFLACTLAHGTWKLFSNLKFQGTNFHYCIPVTKSTSFHLSKCGNRVVLDAFMLCYCIVFLH